MNLDFSKLDGLITTVIQDYASGRVLMVGHLLLSAAMKKVVSDLEAFSLRFENLLSDGGSAAQSRAPAAPCGHAPSTASRRNPLLFQRAAPGFSKCRGSAECRVPIGTPRRRRVMTTVDVPLTRAAGARRTRRRPRA
jgi:hypothetical protein